ncbi:MAG: hypothetical protein QUV07_00580 [Cyanobium sp. CZS 25K]|nr:hypothetical protein [Cyanobium sp. CZS25K]
MTRTEPLPQPLLLDTQLLLWWAIEPGRLPPGMASLLVVQAQLEGLRLLSADRALVAYGEHVQATG